MPRPALVKKPFVRLGYHCPITLSIVARPATLSSVLFQPFSSRPIVMLGDIPLLTLR